MDDILGFFVQSHAEPSRSLVARVLSQINKKMVPGLGYVGAISIHASHVCLLLDPELLQHLTLSEVLFVLHHEFVHFLNDHIPRYMEMRRFTAIDDGMRYIFSITANLSMDMADNAYLRNKGFLAKDGIIGKGEHRIETILPEHAGLDDLMDYEYYQEQLLDEDVATKLLEYMGGPVDWSDTPPEGAIAPTVTLVGMAQRNQSSTSPPSSPRIEFQTPEGKDIPDDVPQVYRDLAFRMRKYMITFHDFIDDAEGMTDGQKESTAFEIRRQMRRVIRRAVADQLSAGSNAGCFEEDIKVWLRDSRVPWQEILVPCVSSLISNKVNDSMVKPTVRRWPAFWKYRVLPFPGTTRANRYKLMFCLDISGSMMTPSLEDAISEVVALALRTDIDVQLWVIECDTLVREEGVYLVKDGDKIEPQFTDSFRIHGRGGTSFDPALEKAAEMSPDVIVYYTDGGAAVPRFIPEAPLYWLISPTGEDPGLPGIVLHMGKYIE